MPEDDRDEFRQEKRHRLANEEAVRQYLSTINGAQRDLKRDMERLREGFGKDLDMVKAELGRVRAELQQDVRGGDERGYAIKRLEERLNDLGRAINEKIADVIVRLAKVEGAFVTREMLKEEISPIWKWTSVAGTAIIGAVVTYGFLLMQGRK